MQRYRSLFALAVAALIVVGGTGWIAAGGDRDRDHDHRDMHRAFGYAFHGDRDDDGWVGVMIDGNADRDGARIFDVVEESPAERAGLERGDVVIGVEGEPVRGPRDLTDRLDGREPGETVELEISRDGDTMFVDVELGERPDFGSFSFHWNGEDGESFRERMEQLGERMGELGERFGEMDFDFRFQEPGAPDAPHAPMRFHFDDNGFHGGPFFYRNHKPRLGVELTEVTEELREHLGGSRDVGVLVGRLIPGMPAEAAGIEVGDLIESVDGESIETTGDLVRALNDREGETLRIGIVRDRRTMTIDVSLPEPERNRPARGPRA